MKVAIIGTGNMASGLATALVTAGHELFIGARDPSKAEALALSLGHAAGSDIAVAATSADLVILALPFGAVATALAGVELTDKIVVDISNPISADYKDLTIGHTTSAAEEIQKLIPQARVVKAFNTIFAQLLAPAARSAQVLQVFVASDDAEAKASVMAVAQTMGFEAMDSGPLSNSRFIEPIGEMNIHFGYFLGHGPAVAPAWVRI